MLAAADGRVVYAGAGLRGYGNLIILKHNNTYLTAYAHNQTLLVKENQSAQKGQKIAEMGNSDADRVKLHFEIRRQGKPVDPSRYLRRAGDAMAAPPPPHRRLRAARAGQGPKRIRAASAAPPVGRKRRSQRRPDPRRCQREGLCARQSATKATTRSRIYLRGRYGAPSFSRPKRNTRRLRRARRRLRGAAVDDRAQPAAGGQHRQGLPGPRRAAVGPDRGGQPRA